ncbi:MAG TPA: HRDC domain-containing protein [Caulobacteraceae bacterium]|jgi:MFS family permease
MTAESRHLLEALWAWRRQAAAQAGSPPHLILTDRTLIEIALVKPATFAALAEVEGVSQTKLDQHGLAVVKLVKAHVFSPADAAFIGFKFVKERPSAVAAWAAVSLVFNLLSAFVGLLLGGQALRTFQAQAGKVDDLQTVFQLLVPAAPALLSIAVITLAGMALVYSSALRIFVGRESHVTFRIGQDEKRVAMTIVTFTLIYFAVTVAVLVGLGLAANISEAFSSFIGGFFVWVTPLVLFSVTTFVIVRLSLTPIIAVDRGRISLKESWVSTRGHFWPLTGSLVLSVVVFIVMAFLALMIVAALNHAISVGTNGAVPRDLLVRDQNDDSSIFPLIVSEVIASISNGMLLPVVLGPLVRAYQAYDAPDAQAQAAPAFHA